MKNSEMIFTIKWTKNDIVEALGKEGIDPNEENINKIISYQNLKYVEENTSERG